MGFREYLEEGKKDTPAMIARIAKVKNEFVTAIRKVKTEVLRIEWFAFETDSKSFYVIYDTPREIRHPDEYGGEDEVYRDKSLIKFGKEDDKIMKVLSRFMKKYPKFNFHSASDANGQGIEKFY